MYDNVSLTAVSEEEELMLAKLQRMDICSTYLTLDIIT